MNGVLSLILWKSSRSNGQPASLDMASRCSTALVLPPSAMMVVMAFSKALGVMMSRGLMSRFSSSSKALQGHPNRRGESLLKTLRSRPTITATNEDDNSNTSMFRRKGRRRRRRREDNDESNAYDIVIHNNMMC